MYYTLSMNSSLDLKSMDHVVSGIYRYSPGSCSWILGKLNGPFPDLVFFNFLSAHSMSPWFTSETVIQWNLNFTWTNTLRIQYIDATVPGGVQNKTLNTIHETDSQLRPRNQITINPNRPVRRISKPKRRRPGTRSELASMKTL